MSTKRFLLSAVALAAVLTLVPLSQADTVEFSEVILTTLTPLDGTTYYDPYGISFRNTTYYAVDERFPPAGVDFYGITSTTPDEAPNPDNELGVNFLTNVTSVTFDWLSINSSDIYAAAFDAGGTELGTYAVTGLSGESHGSHTFSGLGLIDHIIVHDGTGQLGIGRLEFTPIPTPSAALLGLVGLVLAGWTGRRHVR